MQWMYVFCRKVNLVSNLTLAKVTGPKPTPSMSLSQSATAPSTPLTPLPQAPSVIIPSSLHAVGPIRKRYSDKCSLAMDQGQFSPSMAFLHLIEIAFNIQL